MNHVDGNQNAGGQVAVAFQANFSNQGMRDENSPALTSNRATAVSAAGRVRRLIPKETERLQGFADDFTLVNFKGKPAADGPRYRAIGNSWAVPMFTWVGKRIVLLEELVPWSEP